jgi:hypothetical protein
LSYAVREYEDQEIFGQDLGVGIVQGQGEGQSRNVLCFSAPLPMRIQKGTQDMTSISHPTK